MKKITIITGLFMASFSFAQSVVKLQFPNDVVVVNFETQSTIWKKSKKENYIIGMDSNKKNEFHWIEMQSAPNSESDKKLGTFVFTDSKASKGYYIQEPSKKKIPFKKL